MGGRALSLSSPEMCYCDHSQVAGYCYENAVDVEGYTINSNQRAEAPVGENQLRLLKEFRKWLK